MAENKEKNMVDDNDDEEVTVLELTDDETGEKILYAQEMVIPVNGENFALLVPYSEDDDEGGHVHDDGCDCDEDAAFFAKIVIDENGEESYEVPSDEEFNAVLAAYDEIMGEDDDVTADEEESK